MKPQKGIELGVILGGLRVWASHGHTQGLNYGKITVKTDGKINPQYTESLVPLSELKQQNLDSLGFAV